MRPKITDRRGLVRWQNDRQGLRNPNSIYVGVKIHSGVGGSYLQFRHANGEGFLFEHLILFAGRYYRRDDDGGLVAMPYVTAVE